MLAFIESGSRLVYFVIHAHASGEKAKKHGEQNGDQAECDDQFEEHEGSLSDNEMKVAHGLLPQNSQDEDPKDFEWVAKGVSL